MGLKFSKGFGSAKVSRTKMINIRSLKQFAFEMLPKDSPLRDLLLTEKDELPDEFIIKMEENQSTKGIL